MSVTPCTFGRIGRHINLTYTYKLKSYLIENTILFHQKGKSVNFVYGNNYCFYKYRTEGINRLDGHNAEILFLDIADELLNTIL